MRSRCGRQAQQDPRDARSGEDDEHPNVEAKDRGSRRDRQERAGRFTLLGTGASNDRPNPSTGKVCRNRVCSANQIDRLRIMPTTAAVMAESAPASALLPRSPWQQVAMQQ